MSAAKHTPGPWRVTKINRRVILVNKHGGCITYLDDTVQPESANAALIAAAPELLAALEAAWALRCANCPTVEAETAAWLKVRAALAKAKGSA